MSDGPANAPSDPAVGRLAAPSGPAVGRLAAPSDPAVGRLAAPAGVERYARHIILPEIGGAGQAAIGRARIAVLGAGGIGNAVIPALAAAGVAMLRIIDDDQVDLSNLHRQTLFTTADIGAPKADVAALRAAALNPAVAVEPVRARITAANVADQISGVDLIIDGTDNFATRLIVSDAATRARVPLVSAAIARFQGQVATFAGWRADGPCYRCFVGDAHDPDDCDSCAEQGVPGPLVALVGALAAHEALRWITGYGGPPNIATGQLLLLDGLAPSLRAIRLPKDPGCMGCGAVP